MIIIAGILFRSFTRISSKSSIFLNVIVLLFSLLFFSTFFSMASYASEEVRRILSLVDYIGGDYKNAVQGGKVISQEEYKEMLEFSSDTLKLFLEQKALDGDRAGIEADLITLKNEIEDKSSNNKVELLSKGIKDRIISAYGITPYPENHPSFRAGMDLYERNCAQCHGVLGAGNGPLASGIKPPPRSFTDGNAIGGLSPFKIYNTMSFGIEGTGMPSFKNFSEMDKWNVAFYVLSLRYGQKESEEGKKIFNASGIPDSMKEPKTLATLSDDELSDRLNPYLKNDKDLPGVVAFLRRDNIETKGTEGDPIVLTNTMLKEAIRLYQQGNGKDAYTKVLDAYLDGFERVEPTLISKDKAFVSMVESKFVTFRGLIKDGRPVDDVKSLYKEIEADLMHASAILQNNQSIGKALLFLNSFAIMLREGLEAALIVAAVLAFLGATGAKGAIKFVHLGWVLALVAGILTWFLAQTVISISGAQREIIEGVTSLLATTVLFYVSYWLITKIEVRKWKEYIHGKVKKALSKKSLFALASISFFAVYREAFETVLFYQALLLQSDNSRGAVIWGILAGAILLAGLVIVIFKLGLRVPLKYFFSITSLFLYLLSFVFAGKGIRGLQEAGLIGITPVSFIPQVDILGIYPTLETSIFQGILLLAFILGLVWLGFIKHEKEKKALVVSVSRIADDMKSMHEAFEHIKTHIIEWKKCEDIDLEAEEIDRKIQGVISHVDELENKLDDFFDVVSKNSETTNTEGSQLTSAKPETLDRPKPTY